MTIKEASTKRGRKPHLDHEKNGRTKDGSV
jgi:hypothetical protein